MPYRIVLVALISAYSSALFAEAPRSQPAPAGPAAEREAPPNPKLVKLPFSFPRGMENTPVVFRGREMAHIDEGHRVMKSLIEKLTEEAKVESGPQQMGRRLTCTLAPR